MLGVIIFGVVLLAFLGVSIWYSFHRQSVYDEMMESMRSSLETIADCCVDVSCAVDTADFEGEQK